MVLFSREAGIAALFIFFFLTTACSRPVLPSWLGGQPESPTPTPIVVTTQLQLWSWPSGAAEDAHLQALVKDFEQRNPSVAVELIFPDNYTRRLRTALGTENPPDVFLLNLYHLPDLVAEGVLAPLPASLAADRDLYPHLRRAMQIGGTPYCMPQSLYTLALFYNRARFDEAELAHPDETWDWAALQAAATALTDVETNMYGLVLSADVSRWAAFLAQAGGALLASDGRTMAINTPAAQEALDYYTTLILEGAAAPPTTLNSRWPGEAFAQGRVAMLIEANWTGPYLQANAPDLAYGLTALPAGPAGRATISFATCYAIAAQTGQQSAAADLVAYLTSAEAQKSWFPVHAALATRPSLESQWRTSHPTLQPFIDTMDSAIEWQLPANFQPWVEEMNDGLRRIFGGFIPASGLLAEAEAVGNELLVVE